VARRGGRSPAAGEEEGGTRSVRLFRLDRARMHFLWAAYGLDRGDPQASQEGVGMTCEKCGKAMIFDYQVEERKVLFKLWNCECGYRFLEKKNLRRLERAMIK
jgi:hypothetical protein